MSDNEVKGFFRKNWLWAVGVIGLIVLAGVFLGDNTDTSSGTGTAAETGQ